MSADDTVIVLRTKGRNGNEAEYRVVHAYISAMDRLFDEADYPSENNRRVNRDWTLIIFRKAEVFIDAWQAMKSAASWNDVEYGIQVVDLSDIYFPASERKRRQRRFYRPRQEQPAAG